MRSWELEVYMYMVFVLNIYVLERESVGES